MPITPTEATAEGTVRSSARVNKGHLPERYRDFDTTDSAMAQGGDLNETIRQESSTEMQQLASSLSLEMQTQLQIMQNGFVEQMREMRAALATQIKELQTSLQSTNAELNSSRAERLRLEELVKAQNTAPVNNIRLSPATIDQPRITDAAIDVPDVQPAGQCPPARAEPTRRLHELPKFGGKPEEWPRFIITFRETTRAYRYTELENSMRLQTALYGAALEAVESIMIHPENVQEVISLLEFQFGRPESLINSQLQRVREIHAIGDSRMDLLVPFSIKVKNLVKFMEASKCAHHIADPMLVKELVQKLPMGKRVEWARYTTKLQYFPTLSNFSDWLSEEAKLVCIVTDCVQTPPITINQRRQTDYNPNWRKNSETRRQQGSGRNVLLHANELSDGQRHLCVVCNKSYHTVGECRTLINMCVTDRWKEVKSHRLCFSCLQIGHIVIRCPSRKLCDVNNCKRVHHPLLHEAAETTPAIPITTNLPTNTNIVLNCHPVLEAEPEILFRVLPVQLYGPHSEVSTYALIDEGSSVTMIDEEMANMLQLSGESNNLTLQWFGNRTTSETSRRVSLQIRGVTSKHTAYPLCNVRTVRKINLPVQTLKLSALQSKYHHLKGLPIAGYAAAVPTILIGLDNCHLGVPIQSICSPVGPVVAETKLGWVVYGPHPKTNWMDSTGAVVLHNREADITSLDVLHNTIPEHDVSSTKQLFDWEIVFKPACCGRMNVTLPDSRQMAVKRLQSIENKMRRDPSYAEKYENVIKHYLDVGYARKLSEEEASQRTAKTWYLPHFGVSNVNKPDKLRLVFDAAAKVNGISLNTHLSKGPDQSQPLIAVLHKFRLGPVGVCGDIKEMFHQVLIRPEDQEAQRFLWRHGNQSIPVDTYVMNVMIFGATCSPSTAQYVKNKNASEFAQDHPEAAEAIINNHYVDDYVKSFASEADAISTTRAVVDIHRRGGFILRNFVSNSNQVLRDLTSGHCEPAPAVNMNLDADAQVTDKILGMYWDTKDDVFTFQLKFHRISQDILLMKRTPTKREALSLAMSVFDPFGLLADYMLFAKVLLQEVWRTGIGWDDCLPSTLSKRWFQWQDELTNVSLCRIPRCYSHYINDSDDIQLHIFADASESAFAAVAYWRVKRPDGNYDVSFITGKTRCAPLKLLSVPRLELQGAVLASRLQNMIKTYNEVNIARTVFWTDSKTVLNWIQSSHRRYKPFVAHRIAEILESSDMSNWRWVPSSMNAADDATRAEIVAKFDPHSRWLFGPSFLKSPEDIWPNSPTNITNDDPPEELRPRQRHINLHMSSSGTVEIVPINKFSDYYRLCRVTACVLRVVNNFMAHLRQDRTVLKGELNSHEIDNAELYLCRTCQAVMFPKEYTMLNKGQPLQPSSPIYRLSPYVDEMGVMRHYGRIDAASILPIATKRPIILDRHHKLAYLIVRHYHCRMKHQNQGAIICAVREKFWIPQVRVLVKRVKLECHLCKLRLTIPQPPMMGQLPEDRLTPYVRPFTYTGLDYFGPVYVTVGRRREKRWVALFTCLTIRAVHLELAADLTTDACIICIRNFVNIRGVPKRIRSDNGTNFVGAERELKTVLDAFDQQQIQSELTSQGIQWVFNCPSNPEAGGSWERLVQSIKKVLAVTVKEIAPRVETFRSLLFEAANIVNSRPLTHIPIDAVTDEPLTPNHFLLGGANSTQTPGPIDKRLMCLRKQWRIAQQLKNTFWRRWISEYLPVLTRRTKWFKDVKPLDIGQLVLICEVDQPRSQWRRGKILRVHKGCDGRVRSAEVKTNHGVLKRPASKLAVIDVNLGESPPASIHGGRDVAH